MSILVPQTGQVPVVAGLPFFMVIACGLLISRFSLHLRQYPVTAITPSLWLRRADLSPSWVAREAHPREVLFSNSAPIQNRPDSTHTQLGLQAGLAEYGPNSGPARPKPPGVKVFPIQPRPSTERSPP